MTNSSGYINHKPKPELTGNYYTANVPRIIQTHGNPSVKMGRQFTIVNRGVTTYVMDNDKERSIGL